MAGYKDLTGQKFGRLTVIERAEKDKNGRTRWLCQCECGKIIVLPNNNLQSGNTRSCGCLHKEITAKIGIDLDSTGRLKEFREKNRFGGTLIGHLQRKVQSNSSTGVKGVAWDKGHNKFVAYINLFGKKKHLGYFEKFEDAVEARKEAEEKYFESIIKKYRGAGING